MEIAIGIAALVVGCIIGVLAQRGRQQALAAQNAMLLKQLEDSKAETRTRLAAAKDEAEQRIAATKAEDARLLASVKAEAARQLEAAKAEKDEAWKKVLQTQERRFDESLTRMGEQMKNATAAMLRERQKEFADSSSLQLGQIVNPLRETIDKMKQTMADTTLRQTEMSSVLKDNIERSMQQAMAAKQSADELAHALKHGSKVQGDWGEAVLDELLASQGLVRGVHYDTQAVIRDAQGNSVHTDGVT